MTLDDLLKVASNGSGPFFLIVAIYFLSRGTVVFQREKDQYKFLWEEEKVRSAKLEGMNDELIKDLAKQNAGHLATLEYLKELVPSLRSAPDDSRTKRYTPSDNPGRRRDDPVS